MAKDYKSVAKSFRSEPVVKGRTVIDHQHRIRLNIGCNGYAILDHFRKNPEIDYQKIYEKTGFKENVAKNIILDMKNKGFLSENSAGTKMKVSTKFYSKNKIKEQFDQFWDLSSISTMKKTSVWPDTKVTSKRMFEAAVEEEGFYYIMERRNLYIKFLELEENSYRRIMSAARFLNPKEKEYAAEFEKMIDNSSDAPVIPGDSKPITSERLKKEYE